MQLRSKDKGGWLEAGAGLEHVGRGRGNYYGQVLGAAVDRVALTMQMPYPRP